MNIYLAQATPDFEKRLVNAALQTMPEEKRVRMKRCRVAQQRTCMALSEVLLAWALFENRNIEVHKSDHFVGEYGKPMLCNGGDIVEFNISHSGSFVLIGIDENPVGVDIQQWGRDVDLIARKIMLPDEYEAWTKSPDKVVAFYDFWTRTESMLKWRGVGIAGLRDASLPESISIHPVAVFQGYSAAVCGCVPKCCSGALRAREIEVEMLLTQAERRRVAL